MMKKRLVALGLAGVMLMGMSMNVFAATTSDTINDQTKTKTTTVENSIPVSYTVTIPATIDQDDIVKGIDITGKTNLNIGDTLNVKLNSDKIAMKRVDKAGVEIAGDKADNYILTLATVTSENLVLGTFDENVVEGTKLSNKLAATANSMDDKKAGNYSGSITFELEYMAATVAP